jgi:adenylate cyclase, class 2
MLISMSHLNVEIKARCKHPDRARQVLRRLGADFRGVDRQTDTYFRCPRGRLKLRQGNIENALIHYDRANQEGPKRAHVTLHRLEKPGDTLRETLTQALGVTVTVRKRREIYFIDNVKFHIDDVEGLGGFVEIEAIDADATYGEESLRQQCDQYMDLLGVRTEDLVACSYSDLLSDPGR